MEERHKSDRMQKVRRRILQDNKGDNNNDKSDNNNAKGDNHINQLLEEERKRQQRRWNFNFERGIPLPGRYEWVPVDKHGNEIPNSAILNNDVQNSQNGQVAETRNDAQDSKETGSDQWKDQ